jgi:hypothetical protein
MSASRLLRLPTIATLTVLGVVPALLGACGSSHGGPQPPPAQRVTGQSEFLSAPLPGTNYGAAGGAENAGAAAPSASGSGSGGGSGGGTMSAPGGNVAPRDVQETDLYRYDAAANRLYYLNSYRGLMVFDVSDADHPKLIGRSAIFGDPQEMLVQNGIAVVVVGDWYGRMADGTPFHGSIARGLDCNDPSNIKVVGEAYLGGWVRDTRVVGNVLYTVADDYGWEYGWEYGWAGYYGPYYGGGGGVAVATPAAGGASGAGGGVSPGGSSANGPRVSIASVNFANGVVTKVGEQTLDGYNGIINVTASSIMLAHQHVTNPSQPWNGPGQTDLQYIDITDPNGAIKLRGSITIDGAVTGWGPDNGRWNLDFQDNLHAHALGCAQQYCGGSASDTYKLATVDFTNPDAPTLSSSFPISGLGWAATARFDSGRMYLSPSDYSYQQNGKTPLSIYDLSNPTAPKLAGSTGLDGNIWMFIPNGNQLFALGNTYSPAGPYDQNQVEVQYIDVTNPAAPKPLGSSAFGQGWSWSPAADTFKAFVVDDTKGLAVVPFSGWDPNARQYANGVQLVQFNQTSLTGGGAAHTKGWVERGIFVANRLYSLSDQALSVVDYTNPSSPQVLSEMTLARNVVNAQPQGPTIAELSSDWWGNDTTSSEMRVLPIANAEETTDNGTGVSVAIDGVDAQVFQNGTLGYVVSTVQSQGPCPYYGGPGGNPGGTCTVYQQKVTVVDTSNGGAVKRGSVLLPNLPYWYGGWGWEGFWYYDWFDGADIVQVGNNALAFRRWFPQYAYTQNGYEYIDSLDALFVVDLSNPDAPTIASLTVTDDPTGWWGNMKAIGNTLYTTHYEWVTRPDPKDPSNTIYYVKYYLDQVDLSDRSNPKIGQKINVPGVLVGASNEDPTLLYFADYRWDGTNPRNDIAVAKIDSGKAYLQGFMPVDGWVGNVIVQNDKAYMTAQEYDWMLPNGGTPAVELHQVDLSNPQAPTDYVATDPKNPWGWLLDVEGDRAIVTSGWGPIGVDIFKLHDQSAPTFDQSARTLGWWSNSIARQGNSLYLTSGYWGVQRIDLQ